MNLLCSELTDEGLASLGGLRILRQLHLYQAGVSCSGLELFAQQPGGQQLQNLVLYGCGKLTTLEGLGEYHCCAPLSQSRDSLYRLILRLTSAGAIVVLLLQHGRDFVAQYLVSNCHFPAGLPGACRHRVNIVCNSS